MITISGKSATLGGAQVKALLAPTLAALDLGQECRIVNNAIVPMALSGGALFEPVATLMVGGLLLASPLTLFFVPPTYRLFFRRSIAAPPVIQPVEATP